MQSIWSTSAARRLFGTSIAARLPMVMLSIGLIVHAQRLTGSFAAAGLVAAALALAEGIGGPLLGRLADRRGQTVVLLAGAAVAGSALAAVALLPAGAPAWLLLALATVLGLGLPPVAACLRTLLPEVISGDEAVRRAYAAETTANELTWIAGPPIVLVLGDLLSTGAALLIAGIILVAATAAFALQPASRAWRPAAAADVPRGGSLRAPAMRALVLVLVAVGVVFGAVEVTVAAATQMLGSTASAGPLLGVWGAGSVAGGIAAARFGGGARTGTGLALILAAMAASHLALAPAAHSVAGMAICLALAGATIAPTLATVYAMVERSAPAGTLTEAFAWLNTASAIGTSIGAAAAGAATDAAGPTAGFVLAGGAGAAAVLIAVLCARMLPERSRPAGLRRHPAAIAEASR
ncbi:MAG TPA: MFS transporter [Gaiellales bacterium]|jgi:MFS family permease